MLEKLFKLLRQGVSFGFGYLDGEFYIAMIRGGYRQTFIGKDPKAALKTALDQAECEEQPAPES
jgi:hypothetical protein